MIDKLFEIGVTRGMSIFFFLFVALAIGFWLFLRSIMNQNDSREERYISTIDKLADSLGKVETVNHNIAELRQEFKESADRHERMMGRVLDRLPIKGGE